MKSTNESLCGSASMNATILEYYNKFGKDRRLEKYLRIRCPTRDDTEGSSSNKICSKSTSSYGAQNKAVKDTACQNLSDNADAASKGSAESSEAESAIVGGTSTNPTTSKTEVSNKRLEWDSLGDVGYGKHNNTNKSLSAKAFDVNVFKILSSTGCSSAATISGEQPSSNSQVPDEKQKEKWRRTLETIKNKYDSQLLNTSSCHTGTLGFNSESFSALSTPSTDKNNKSVQTSKVNLECKKIQVSLAARTKSNSSTSSTSNSGTVKKLTSSNISEKSSDLCSSKSATSSSGQPELEMGINLLCLLIESKNLSMAKKKKLAKKIVSKISGKVCLDINSDVTSSANCGTGSTSTSSLVEVIMPKANVKSTDNTSPAAESLETISGNMPKEMNANLLSDCSKENSQDVMQRPKSLLSSRKSMARMRKSHSADDVALFMRSWLDPMTKSEVKYQRFEKSRKEVRKQEKPIFVPVVRVPDTSNQPNMVIVDKKAGGDFVPTGYRRSSEILDFITNERKSHLKWIESEIDHLENLKQLLLKSKTNFTPCKPEQQVYSAVVQNMYDNVASTCTDSTLSSEEKRSPVIYHETEVVSEREEINLHNLYTKTVTRRAQDAIIYDSAEVDSAGSQTTKSAVKNITVEVLEEKKLPKRNYQHSEDHAEKQLRSKLQTPTTLENTKLGDFVRARKHQFLERCKKTYSPEDSENSTENRHYSEPCDKPALKHGINGENVSTSTGSTNSFISSGSISIPEVATSSTTTTHQYDHQRGIGVQTTDSLLHMQKFNTQDIVTIRSCNYSKNKQTQTKPPSIAYVISFGNSDLSFDPAQTKLRDYLEKRRPEFTERINQRVVILSKIRELRKERDKQIREIVENYSVSSIPKKLQELPPPPTKYIRVFSTREMKARTQRRYSQLPEVTERKRRQKLDKTKKSNRIITEMFNKIMQLRARNGKLNLEQSMTVL